MVQWRLRHDGLKKYWKTGGSKEGGSIGPKKNKKINNNNNNNNNINNNNNNDNDNDNNNNNSNNDNNNNNDDKYIYMCVFFNVIFFPCFPIRNARFLPQEFFLGCLRFRGPARSMDVGRLLQVGSEV